MNVEQQLQNAKRSTYDRLTIDTESLKRNVFSMVTSSTENSNGTKNKRRKYALFAIPVVALLLSGFAYAATLRLGYTQSPSIAKAISQAPFPIQLPKHIPMHPTYEWGQVSYLGGKVQSNTEISLYWTNKLETITEDVALTSGAMIRLPRHQPFVHLANDQKAIFVLRSGSLFWTIGNETYRLTLHPWNALSVSELIKIADSVK